MGSLFDAVIVGAGPAGLSAALTLGRACKRVAICSVGPGRNGRAAKVQNFFTRDGTPPLELRDIGREQLAAYPNVEVRDVPVKSIRGTRGAFEVEAGHHGISARRVLLCTGVIDEMPGIPGFAELWGSSIFQCPYCHGFEKRDWPWGYLARHESHYVLPFVVKMRAWTRDVTFFTNGSFELSAEGRERLEKSGVRIETAPIARLEARGLQLQTAELADGRSIRCEALFTAPKQSQVALITQLGVELDDDGYVRIDPIKRETSVPGIYAAGDLTARMQGVALSSASGMHAAVAADVDLAPELIEAGVF